MGQALSRLVDPSALDACDKPRGRMSIEIPVSFAGAEIEVRVPGRLLCARCDGGGCDGCERRGGHRIPGPEEARRVQVVLPLKLESGMVLRVAQPLVWANADESIIEQLYIEARLAERASENVKLLALYNDNAPDQPPPVPAPAHFDWARSHLRLFAFLVIATALTIGFLLLRR